MFVILTTAACQVTPKGQGSATKPSSVGEPRVQSTARKSDRPAIDARVSDAEALRAAGDQASASKTLDGVDPARLDASSQFAYYSLRALLALDAQDYASAEAAIALTIPTNAEERNAYILTVATLSEAKLSYEDAAVQLMGFSYSGSDVDATKARTVADRTWAAVNRTPAYRISALAAQPQNDIATAWWKLADALQRSFDLEAE